MRRLIVATVVVLAWVLMPGVMPRITHADPSSGAYDFATGAGTLPESTQFGVSAHCQVAGPAECDQTTTTAPSGHAFIDFALSTGGTEPTGGPITCLRVVNNIAVFTYRNTAGTDVGPYFTWSIEDNGPPVDGQPVDTVGRIWVTADPNFCNEFPATQGRPIESGNIVVNQGTLTP